MGRNEVKSEKPLTKEELKAALDSFNRQIAEKETELIQIAQKMVPYREKLAELNAIQKVVNDQIDKLNAQRASVSETLRQISYERHLERVQVYISREMPEHVKAMLESESPTVKALGEVIGIVLNDQAFGIALPVTLEPDLKSLSQREPVHRIAVESPGARIRLAICTDGTYGVSTALATFPNTLTTLDMQGDRKFHFDESIDPRVSDAILTQIGETLSHGTIVLPRNIARYSIPRTPRE